MPSKPIITEHLINCLNRLGAKKILDVGCGAGALSQTLNNEGFEVTGIEPNPTSFKKAISLHTKCNFINAGAQNIPLEDDAFDAIVLVNSFHHIPASLLDEALHEFNRLLRKDGILIIIEPLTYGSFFDAMQPVEDETDIRNHALKVLQKAVEGDRWHLTSRKELDRISRFTSCDKFIDTLVAVDPDRQQAADQNRRQIEKLFSEYAQEENGEFILIQPHTIWCIKPVS